MGSNAARGVAFCAAIAIGALSIPLTASRAEARQLDEIGDASCIVLARIGVECGDAGVPGGGIIEDFLGNLFADVGENLSEGVFEQIANWVGSGAQMSTHGVIRNITGDGPTAHSPILSPVQTQFTEPFIRQYELMKYIGLLVLMPLVLIAIIQAVAQGSMNHLVRTVTVFLPVAIIGSALAVKVVEILMSMDAEFSSIVSQGFGDEATTFLGAVGSSVEQQAQEGDMSYLFVSAWAYLFLMVAGIVLWVELLVRESAVQIATLFLPIAFAALVWPVWAGWFRRFTELIIMLIFSKFLVVSVISLGVGMLAANIHDPGEPGGDDMRLFAPGRGFISAGNPEFASESATIAGLLIGGMTFLVAFVTPFTVLRMLPLAEAALASGFQDWRRGLRSQNAFPVMKWDKLAFVNMVTGGKISHVLQGDAKQMPVAGEQSTALETVRHADTVGIGAHGGDGGGST